MGFLNLGLNWVKNTLELMGSFIFPISSTERRLKVLSSQKLKSTFPSEWISNDTKTIALFPYKNPFIKEAIHLLKYRKNQYSINLFAQVLGESIISFCEEILPFCSNPKIILIPIPNHNKSLQERGFNHTVLLTEKIISIYGRDFFEIRQNILNFKKETKKQTACKNRIEREENMKNAFEVSKNENFSGRIVIIIDDVTTAGATFNDAHRALNALNIKSPKQIYCFALAH